MVCVYLIGRQIGSSPFGAAFGALSLATGLSVWFYASYAKAYGFTVLLLAAVVLLLLTWRQKGGSWRLYLAAGLVGVGVGAAYQVILLSLPGFLMLVFGRDRRPTRREVLGSIGAGVAATAAVIGFVVIRASQEPAVNWGGATSASRVVDLFRMKDFGFGTKTFGGARLAVGAPDTSTTTTTSTTVPGAGTAPSTATTTATTAPTTATTAPATAVEPPSSPAPGVGFQRLLLSPFRLALYPLWALAEAGPIVALLGLLGAFGMWSRRMPARLALLGILAGNVVGAGVVVGGSRLSVSVPTADRIVSFGGFFLGATLIFAVWAGVGASMVMGWASTQAAGSRSRAERRRRDRREAGGGGFGWQPVVGGALALAIVGMAVNNWPETTWRTPPYARDYATNVFASVPQNTALLTWDADRAFVLEEQQIVDNVRTDVEVIRLEQIRRPWYREQLSQRLGIQLGPPRGNEFEEGAALATQLRASRPVFLDNAALHYVHAAVPDFGFRQLGLVDEAVDGKGKQPPDLATMDRLFKSTYVYTGFEEDHIDRWENNIEMLAYVYAFLDYGSALGNAERYDDAIDAFQNVLKIDPGNEDAEKNIQIALQRRQEAGG